MMCFLGNAMVLISQKRQTFLTMPLWKTEPFTLNCGQTFLAIGAMVYGKLQPIWLKMIIMCISPTEFS